MNYTEQVILAFSPYFEEHDVIHSQYTSGHLTFIVKVQVTV